MIISKPKGNTLFALGMFLLICYGLIGYTLYLLFKFPIHHWYQYVILAVITPIALAVSIKAIQSFKIIYLGKGKLTIRYPLIRKQRTYSMKNLELWKEVIIKTGGSAFKELTLQFGSAKVKLTSQESNAYHKVYGYLKKKHSNKKG